MRKTYYPSRKDRQRITLFVVLLCFAVAAASGLYKDYGAHRQLNQAFAQTDGLFSVHFIDVGQGDAALLVSPEKEYMLVDCGTADSAPQLIKYLTDAGVTSLEYLVLTHPHEDHYGGAESVIAEFPIENLLILGDFADTYPYDRLIYMLEHNRFDKPCGVLKAEKDDEYSFADCADFKILSPEKADPDDYNESSLVIKLIFKNTSFLFTGDAEKASERAMLASGYDLRANVLKAGHHGSSTSDTPAFVKAVSPDYAVISCAEGNSYGHPHEETLQTFEEYHVRVLRTDLDGTIVFASDGQNVQYLESLTQIHANAAA